MYALVKGANLIQLVLAGDELLNIIYYFIIYIIFTMAIITFILLTMWTFYGIFSTNCESKCMWGPYVIVMLFVFLLIFLGAVSCYMQSIDQLQRALEGTMKYYRIKDTLENPTNTSGIDSQTQLYITNAWDEAQQNVSYFTARYQKQFFIV